MKTILSLVFFAIIDLFLFEMLTITISGVLSIILTAFRNIFRLTIVCNIKVEMLVTIYFTIHFSALSLAFLFTFAKYFLSISSTICEYTQLSIVYVCLYSLYLLVVICELYHLRNKELEETPS